MTGLHRSFLALLFALVASVVSPRAHADEVAPSLEGADLRQRAQLGLKQLLASIPVDEQRRLVGAYVAFDPSVSDAIAQVACDDDGDYVVVVSDAMLRLLVTVARADRFDERAGTHKLEDYAELLDRSQTPGRRLLPPAPGFFAGETNAGTYEATFDEALSFILASELARLQAGDLLCARPTATRESGDDVWTTAEQRSAAAVAAQVYPAHQDGRDERALAHLRTTGRSARGALAIVRFFARVGTAPPARFASSYLAHHPGGLRRLEALRRAAASATGPADAKSVTSGS